MKIKVFFLFYFSLLILPLACDFSDCNCSNIKKFFKVDKIYLENIETNTSDYPFNLGKKDDFSNSKYHNFSLSLEQDVTYISDASLRKKCYFPFINSALACECADPGFGGIKKVIDKIEVKTLMPYDIVHPANSDVSSLFYISEKSFNTTVEKLTIQNYIVKMLKSEKQFSPQGFVLVFNHTDNFIEELEKKGETKLQFSINITFTDQTTLSATSHEAILKFNP